MKKSLSFRITALLLSAVMLISLMCSCIYTVPQTEEPEGGTVSNAEMVFDYTLSLDLLRNELNRQRSLSGSDAEFTPDPLFNPAQGIRDGLTVYKTEELLPDYEAIDFLAEEFTENEFNILKTGPDFEPAMLTADEAREDIEYLFRILRTSYGAYVLFGGDEVFGAAKQTALDRLQSEYPSGISPENLRVLLLESVSFIEDSHFAIGGAETGFAEKRYFRDAGKLIFRRDNHGYYACPDNEKDGERWYLDEQDEHYLRLTVAEDGELVYGLFALADQTASSELPGQLTLTRRDGRATDYKPGWSLMSCGFVWNEDYYTRSEIAGIPVIALNTFYLDEDSFDDINTFLNDAKELRDEEVIIVDLRYNTGGYDTLSAMWLYSLTSGTDVPWSVGYAAYISRLNEYILTSNQETVNDLFERLDFNKDYPEYFGLEEDSEEYYVGDTYLVEPDDGYVEYDGTIFVLFNKHTYSAGELALFQFENMSNVIFAGMNSNGCLLTGGTNMDAPVYLPNSGLEISYSMIVVTSDIMEGFDSYGYQPDIMLENDTAIEDIINLWQYYEQE